MKRSTPATWDDTFAHTPERSHTHAPRAHTGQGWRETSTGISCDMSWEMISRRLQLSSSTSHLLQFCASCKIFYLTCIFYHSYIFINYSLYLSYILSFTCSLIQGLSWVIHHTTLSHAWKRKKIVYIWLLKSSCVSFISQSSSYSLCGYYSLLQLVSVAYRVHL